MTAPVETIRIWMLAESHGGDVAGVKALLMRQQEMGLLQILAMDDDVAIIKWRDARMAAVLSGYPEDMP